MKRAKKKSSNESIERKRGENGYKEKDLWYIEFVEMLPSIVSSVIVVP